jgi:pimeloyl-[acyl-carrier protein] synthase
MTASHDALDIDLQDIHALRDENLFPALAGIRESQPVYWSARNSGWFITGHSDVSAAFQDRRLSNVRLLGYLKRFREEWPDKIPSLLFYLPGWVLNNDGEPHARLRKLLVKAISRKYVDSLRPLITRVADALTDKAERLGQADFAAEIAYPLPATVILTMLGISLENLEKVRQWNQSIVMALATARPTLETVVQAEHAIVEMNAMVMAEIAARRLQPRDDFLTTLMSVSEDEDRLSEKEMLGICQVLLTAGHETTVNSMVWGLVAWCRHPAQRALFLGGSVDQMAATNELMRYSGMSMLQRKIALEEFSWHGQSIKPGDFIYLFVGAANRDPAVFRQPDVMDLTRTNLEQTMTFGPGIHHCIGHYLARVELAVFFDRFLRRFDRLSILDPALAQGPGITFRGLQYLNVRFT